MGVLALLAPLAIVAAGCGGAQRVPDVTGQRLDVAEQRLELAGLGHRTVGGGTFGVILHSRWQVCAQNPRAGMKAFEVTLIVARACAVAPASVLPRIVPDVRGENLDAAEAHLHIRGLGYRIEASDEVVVRSHWIVCEQDPLPPARARTVELYLSRDCDVWDE